MLIVDLTNEQTEKAFYNYCERGDLASVHALFQKPQFFKSQTFALAYEKAIESGNVDLLKYFSQYLEFDYHHEIFDLDKGAFASCFQTALEKKQEKVLIYLAQDKDYIQSIDRFLLNYQHPLQYCLKQNLPIEFFSLLVEQIQMNPKNKNPYLDNHDMLHLSIISDNEIYTDYLLKHFQFSLIEMNYDSRLKKSMCYLDYANQKKNVPKLLKHYAINPLTEDKIHFPSGSKEDDTKKYKL